MALAHVGLHRVHDLRVSGAAAEVALQRGADRRAVGTRLPLEEGQRGQEHARRAKAALHGAVAHERILERMQATVALEPAQRHDGAAAQPGRQHQTARHRASVEQHRADAAHTLVAALLDVEDAERVAQQLEERLVGAHLDLARAAIEDEPRDHRRARSTARVSARRHSTPATWRRYAPDTKASEGGSSASRAICAARASASGDGSRPRSASSAARACTGRSATPPKARRASSTRPRPSRLTSATTATMAKSPARRPPSSRTMSPSGSPLMSITTRGRASRYCKIGIRLCPPDSTLPSSPCSRRSPNASSSVAGATYSNGYIT